MKAFVFRVYPSRAQAKCLDETLETARRFYNECLAERKNAYEEAGVSVGKYTQLRHVKERKAENPYAAKVHSHVLQVVVSDLDKAFQAFYRRVKSGEKPGYPRFRGRGRFDSIGLKEYGNGFRLDGRRLKVSGIGRLAVRWHRPLEGTIKTLRLCRRADGWYACFACETEKTVLEPTGADVGIDLGIEHFATLSSGEHIANPRHYRAAQSALRLSQRRVSRRRKGGNNRRKAVETLARAHQKVQRARLDFCHKTARGLVERFDTLAVEKLNIRGMVRCHPLALSISDAGWGIFLQVLAAKAESAGRRVVEVNPAGTSQQCSRCGERVPKKLSQRWHSCPYCDCELQRDHNAALNIKNRGGQLRPALSIPLGVLAGEAAGF